MLGFFNTPLDNIPVAADVGFSPQTVLQHLLWPATDAVRCFIKFSAMKIPPPAMWLVQKLLWALLLVL